MARPCFLFLLFFGAFMFSPSGSSVANSDAVNTYKQVFVWTPVFLLGIYLGEEIARLLCLTFKTPPNYFLWWLHHFTFPRVMWEGSSFSMSSPTLFFSFFSPFFYCCHPSGCEVLSHCGFDLHFPHDKWCWRFFHGFVGYLYVFLRKMSSQILCSFKKLGFFFVVKLGHIFFSIKLYRNGAGIRVRQARQGWTGCRVGSYLYLKCWMFCLSWYVCINFDFIKNFRWCQGFFLAPP